MNFKYHGLMDKHPEKEHWQVYWQRKQELRKQRLRNYILLIIFTIIFGVVIIGLRLDLRKPPEERLYLNLDSWFATESRLNKEEVLQYPQPSSADLEVLIGEAISDAELEFWGETKLQRGSNDELDVLYFARVQVYLIRKKSDDIIVYAGRKKP